MQLITDTDVKIKSEKKERYKGFYLLLLTAVLWSFGGVLIKWIRWNPMAIAGARSAIAAVIILLFLRKPIFTWSSLHIFGAISYALTVVLFVLSTKLTTAANAILLQYTAPIYVGIFSFWLLKERILIKDWIIILCVFGGMILFFKGDISKGYFWGNVLAILSGISFSILIIIMRKLKSISSLEFIFLGNIITAIISIPFMFEYAPRATDVLLLFALGVFQLAIPYIFYSFAINRVTALEASLIPAIEPILNPIWVFLILGEFPSCWSIIGGVVIIFAITIKTANIKLPSKNTNRCI